MENWIHFSCLRRKPCLLQSIIIIKTDLASSRPSYGWIWDESNSNDSLTLVQVVRVMRDCYRPWVRWFTSHPLMRRECRRGQRYAKEAPKSWSICTVLIHWQLKIIENGSTVPGQGPIMSTCSWKSSTRPISKVFQETTDKCVEQKKYLR